MNCPLCSISLQNYQFESKNVDICSNCGGLWFDKGEFQEVLNSLISNNKVDYLNIKEAFDREPAPKDKNKQFIKKCPKCNLDMQVFNYSYDSNVFLDKCISCGGMWTDKDEIKEAARYVKGNPVFDKYVKVLSDMTEETERSRQVTEETQNLSNDLMSSGGVGTGIIAWPIFPLPLKDDLPTEKFSKVTFGLIIFNVLIFIFQLIFTSPEDESFFRFLGVIPLLGFSPERLYSFVTSMFIHGGWLHVLGNMFYLWLFGNNIEDEIGSIKFIIFYLLCGILGGITFCIIHPSLDEPAIGASGAISGVLGAYLLLFPKADLIVLWLGKIRTIPAVFYLIFWIFFQFIYGGVALQTKNVAIGYWAHIGGFIAGLLLIHLFKKGSVHDS